MLSFQQKVDPTGHYGDKKVPTKRLLDALGIVPAFVIEAAMALEEATPRSVMDAMGDVYGFYLGDMEGGTVDSEGVYSYPEDPDLYPLIEWTLGGTVKVYMYNYAIIVVTDGKETIVTRMD